MVTFANAKINLGLNIVRRRCDGYHDLETIFYPAGKGCGLPEYPGNLCDILEVTSATGSDDTLTQLGLCADCPADSNLVMKALRLFREEASKRGVGVPPQEVILEKHIPFGAGIGGGSADATAMLLTLQRLYGEPFSEEELLGMANRLGADCPFFVLNRPAFAEGTGELLSPLDMDLSRYWLALVKPDVSISTREAFSRVTPRCPEVSLASVASMPIEDWREVMSNDFEVSVFAIHPELQAIKRALYSSGAIYASMSGSGSAFYGIFDDRERAEVAAASCGCPYFSVSRMIP